MQKNLLLKLAATPEQLTEVQQKLFRLSKELANDDARRIVLQNMACTAHHLADHTSALLMQLRGLRHLNVPFLED